MSKIEGIDFETKSFRVVTGTYDENCNCIHFLCAYCNNSGSVSLDRGNITPFFSMTCNQYYDEVFLVHWQ